jgi:hypothetical protein
MRNLNIPKEEIAKAFSTILKQWLTVQEMAQVVELTKKETDPLICHTGDFCDSNMAMQAAMVQLGVMPEDDEEDADEALMSLWNGSWDLAKANLFYTEPPKTTEEVIAYLNAKYEDKEIGVISKTEAFVEDEAAAEILIFIESNDTMVLNPLLSSCGRFKVDPMTAYGIEAEDAALINSHNNVGF